MFLVDSSVWIDFFNGKTTRATEFLRARLGSDMFAIGDLMLAETLQGFVHDKDYRKALQLFDGFPLVAIGGKPVAVKAAEIYRILRKKGITVRGVVDALIAAYCIEHSLALLYSDRDFDPMVKYAGLQPALETLN